jgi:hypothetical protein|tara:strand:+ start:486 stop:992 length:507 start_codon:yes stop_codon:yes gene_type:complete
MDDFRIIATIGVFHVPKGASAPVCFPDGEEPVEILSALESMVNEEVEAVIHYLPDPSSPLPGMGSCLAGRAHCAMGHRENPDWMLHYHQTGKLVQEGLAWFINDERVPLGQLPGHKARFIMSTTKNITIEGVPERETSKEDSVEHILGEAAELEELLKELRSVILEGG